MHICTHTCIYVYTDMHIHVFTYVFVYMYINMYILGVLYTYIIYVYDIYDPQKKK